MVRKTLGYFKGEPALFLESTVRDNKNRYVALTLREAWKMSEDCNTEAFLKVLDYKTRRAFQVLGLQVPEDRLNFVKAMSKISDIIAGGMDELVAMKPRTEETARQVRYDVDPPKTLNIDGMSMG